MKSVRYGSIVPARRRRTGKRSIEVNGFAFGFCTACRTFIFRVKEPACMQPQIGVMPHPGS